MRIRSRILLVGGIPIAIAAAIAITALLLLAEADRAREGALYAGTLYRNLIGTVAARDDALNAPARERETATARFWRASTLAHSTLTRLTAQLRDPGQLDEAAAARTALDHYNLTMGQVVDLAQSNDALIADMARRSALLVSLSGETREREYASNQSVLKQLFDTDIDLSAARNVVQRTQNLRAAIAAAETMRRQLSDPNTTEADRAAAQDSLLQALARLQTARTALAEHLRGAGRTAESAELARLADGYRLALALRGEVPGEMVAYAGSDLSAWADRIADAFGRDQYAAQDRLADLVGRTARARTAEQATQEIVLSAVQLSSAAERAATDRDAAAAQAALDSSRRLHSSLESLPVAPEIRAEMVMAMEDWQRSLSATIDGLRRQAVLVAEMDDTSGDMLLGARNLNDTLTVDAEQIGDTIRNILILGAAIGLLLGGLTGFAVARSIIRPIRRLQTDMVTLAEDPSARHVEGTDRGDELGDMARATEFFVAEIAHREHALRQAKEEADGALVELQQAQAELVQAEKLASLGQLVAGIAHEINTPLGIAVTTSTMMSEEVKRIEHAAASRQMPLSVFERFVQRMKEGAALTASNLERAASLVQSFRQVAADQASDQPRRFDVRDWLSDLLTSLGPVLRKSAHDVSVECRSGLIVETYPGALGQVISNLVINAVGHGFGDRQGGRIRIIVGEPQPGLLRIDFADDGKGIPPANLGKVFDPFFTTGRSSGNTGLGLHIVYNLVTSKLRGRIDVESELGKGTRFVIEVPVDVVADAGELRGAAE